MSAGVSTLSDDDLMRALGQAPSPRPDTAAPPPLASMSDDDLMAALGAPAPRGGTKATGPAPNPFQPEVSAPQTPRRQTREAFNARFVGDMSAPQRFSDSVDTSKPLGAALQAKADERLIGAPSGQNARDATLFNFANAIGLNLPRNMMAGAEALRSGKGFGESYRYVHDVEDALSRQYPKAALGGTVAGLLGGAVALPGLSGGTTMAGRAGQAAITGAGYGAAAEALDSHDPLRTLAAGGVGGLAGGVLSPAVEKLAPVAGRGIDYFLQRVGTRTPPAPRTTFSPDEAAALQAANIDPAQITADRLPSFLAAFQDKGASPAVAREAQAAEFGIPLSRGQATADPMALRFERAALSGGKGVKAQEIGDEFQGRQRDAIISAQDIVGRAIAGSRTPIDSPRAAGEAVADAARRYSDDAAFRAAAAQRRADEALEAVRGHGVPADTLDAAAMASQATRDAAAQAKAAYRSGYAEVAKIPGTFAPGALDRMGSRVRDRLGADLPLDDVLTPSAVRAIRDLDELPGIFGLEPGQGPDLKQVDQLRKRLVAYYGNTRQNPTDRAVMGRVLSEFDQHVHDAMDVGAFPHVPSAAPAGAGGVVDDFPGFALAGIPDPAAVASAASRTTPETMGQYIARQGGMELTDDARAADFHRWQAGGLGRVARPGGVPLDAMRDKLVVAGFIRPDDETGAIARNIGDEVMEALRAERQGRPTYRFADEERAANSRRALDQVADENADYAAQIDRQARRMVIDLEGYGLRRQDLDDEALSDAAGIMLRREAADAGDAYDMAVARRAEMGDARAPQAGGAADDVPFPDLGAFGGAPAAGGFPIGDTSASDAMKRARGLFRDYKQAFAPRGPGDAAGRNLAKIVDRDATPNEVASMLFGGATGRVSGAQIETLDRLREVVGETAPAWQAVQQAVMGRYLTGGDVGRRLDYLLRGEGRDLASRVLTPQQRAGLDAFRTGTVQAENARTSVPDWIADLGRGGYDPNRVLSDLFGSGVPGARPGQAFYGRGLKQFFGSDSLEWANLRQAAWLNLIQHGREAGALSPKREAERIRAFAQGEGKGLAKEMFSADELALMERYAAAVRATDVPKGGRLPDGGRAAALGGHVLNVIAGAVGFKLAGPPGAAAAYGARVGQRALQGGLTAGRAGRSFNEGAPRVPRPAPAYAPAFGFGAARGAGLLAADAVPGGR